MSAFYTAYLLSITVLLMAVVRYLAGKVGINRAVTHPGVIILIFYYLYCMIPVLFFLTNTVEGAPINWGIYSDEEIRMMLWRSLLFAVTLSAAICFFSEKKFENVIYEVKFTGSSVLLIAGALVVPNLVLIFLSAPVETYYDYYTRFDHLTGIFATISVISKRMIWGFTPILVFALSVYYRNNLTKYCIFIAAVVVFTLLNSYGARIDAILILIQAVAFWYLWNRKPISRWQIASIFPASALAMYGLRYMELVRLDAETSFDISFSSALLVAPGEFFALMFPSIELYRLSTAEPFVGFSYYFKDIITMIPFIDTSKYDLMYWYWKTFVPSAPVAPNTMGVLADPAIMGDWWLVLQGIVIGKLVNVINRFRESSSIYMMAAFGYLASNGVLVLKYNMLTYIDMFINNFLLGMALLWLVMTIQKSSQHRRQYG